MRDQYKVLTEKYELVLEADTEQLATPQGREIKGVFVPTEIENWINNVMYHPKYNNNIQKKFIRYKKADLDYTAAQLKIIIDRIYNKWKDKSFKEVQDALGTAQPIERTLAYASYYEKKTPEERRAIKIKSKAQTNSRVLNTKQVFNTGNLQTTSSYFRSLIVQVLRRARERAREENLPFFYSTDFATQLSPKKQREEAIDYIISIWPKDNICPATGIKLSLSLIGNTTDNTPELDKIIPERGYVKGNVAIISKLANVVKSDGNLNDLNKVYEYCKKGTKVLKEIKNHLNGYRGEIDNPVIIQKGGPARNGSPVQKQRLHWSLGHAQDRAKEKNLPFNINTEYLRNIFPVKSDMICPVLGIPLIWSNKIVIPNSPSLDRIIPELGYVEGNVCFISYKANTMKSNATTEQVKGVRDWVKRVTQS